MNYFIAITLLVFYDRKKYKLKVNQISGVRLGLGTVACLWRSTCGNRPFPRGLQAQGRISLFPLSIPAGSATSGGVTMSKLIILLGWLFEFKFGPYKSVV
jgi:hypothetical protein